MKFHTQTILIVLVIFVGLFIAGSQTGLLSSVYSSDNYVINEDSDESYLTTNYETLVIYGSVGSNEYYIYKTNTDQWRGLV